MGLCKGKKNPYGLEKLALVLMPTYPSSGSENGLGAVAADSENDDLGTAYEFRQIMLF